MGAISGNLSPDSRLADTDKNKSGAQISNSCCRCKCTCVQLLHRGSRSKKYYASLTRFQFVSPSRSRRRRPWFLKFDICLSLGSVKEDFQSRPLKKHPGAAGMSSFPIYSRVCTHERCPFSRTPNPFIHSFLEHWIANPTHKNFKSVLGMNIVFQGAGWPRHLLWVINFWPKPR